MVETLVGQVDRTVTYDYDAQYRLTYEIISGQTTHYLYDAAGNRTRKVVTVDDGSGPVNTVTNMTYDVLNRLLTAKTGPVTTTFAYDLNGSLITQAGDPATAATFTWDVHNRLVTINSGGVVETNAYDYRTRRQSKQMGNAKTIFRYDQGDSFQELQANVIQVEYVRGSGMGGGIGSILYANRETVEETFSYNPSVGHVVALTDAAGVVTSTNRYDAGRADRLIDA
jgi:YD repeat-containing protein